MALKHTVNMALKNTVNQTLTDQQRLERLLKLCDELQAAVDQAGDHRRLLEQVKQTAQELLTDHETRPQSKKKKT
jgi:hypothetical protein